MMPSIFPYDRRDTDWLKRESRRDTFVKSVIILLLAIGFIFVIGMAWKQWRLHERGMETAYVMCVQHLARHPMSDASLAANVSELCSR